MAAQTNVKSAAVHGCKIPPAMKSNKTIERIIAAVCAAALIAAFVVCCSKTQYGHEWHEMYRDDHIVVERCALCGEERSFNPY